MAKLIRHCSRCNVTIEQNNYEPNTPADDLAWVIVSIQVAYGQLSNLYDGPRVPPFEDMTSFSGLCESCRAVIVDRWQDFKGFVLGVGQP